jgi:hypothetical protein
MRALWNILFFLALSIAAIGVPAGALLAGANQTPTSDYGWEIKPYRFHLGDRPEMKISAKHQGYDVITYENQSPSFSPHPRVSDVMGLYASGAGVGMINSHGSPQGQAIEVYPYTQAGEASWDSAYTWYVNHGYAGKVYKGYREDWGWHIGIYYDTAVREWSYLSDAVIHNQVCYGGQFDGWYGARVWFGPWDSCSVDLSMANVRELWEGLDGIRGKAKRVAGEAYLDAPNLAMGGNGETTLAPAVGAYAPPENSDVDGDGVPGLTVFDTRMDICTDASNVVHGDGALNVEDEHWSRGERDTLKYTLRSVIGGTGCLRINENAMSEGGLSLDGNQNPSGTDGVGPSRDDYVICYTCTDTDPNYAARFASSWAYRQDDMVVVGWHAEAEIGTAKYVVEGGDGDDWQALGEVSCGEVIAPNVYVVSVEGGHEYYRVVELDAAGRRCEFRPLIVREHEPAFASEVVRLATRFGDRMTSERLRDARCHPSASRKGPDRSLSYNDIPDWVFYGPDSLLAECMPAVDWFELNGLAVDTVHALSPDY